MDRHGFQASSPGTLVPTLGGRKAFVPAPLPPTFDLNAVMVPLMRATEAVSELRGIGRTIANPLLLIRPLQRREAVASSGMEGTHTSLSELFRFEAGEAAGAATADAVEVRNYVIALEAALGELGQLPISPRLLRNAHRRLLNGVTRERGAAIDAGELKRDQNWIGGVGKNIADARFIPPPPRESADALDNLMAYVSGWRDREAPKLIDAALVHYQFETIHPFGDGNGRVGRMLTTLMMVDNELLPQPLLYLSPYLEQRKRQYIDLMFEVSRSAAWAPWISFFLKAVSESAAETIQVVERLRALHADYRERCQTARKSALLPRIVDLAFERPARTMTEIATALDITYAGAANNVRQLLQLGIAVELPSYPKLILFPEIIDALQSGPTPQPG